MAGATIIPGQCPSQTAVVACNVRIRGNVTRSRCFDTPPHAGSRHRMDPLPPGRSADGMSVLEKQRCSTERQLWAQCGHSARRQHGVIQGSWDEDLGAAR